MSSPSLILVFCFFILGEFSCAYHQKFDFGTITHKARDTLDVVLLPDIYITSDPMFPRCEGGSTKVKVTVKCEIKASSEVYEVKWHGHGKNTDVKPLQHSSKYTYATYTVFVRPVQFTVMHSWTYTTNPMNPYRFAFSKCQLYCGYHC